MNAHDDEVRVGLATKLGVAGAVLLAVASVLTSMIDGDPEAWGTLATVVGSVTILGRMLQAAAQALTKKADAGDGDDDEPEDHDDLDARLHGTEEGPIPVEDRGNDDADLKAEL